MSGGQMPELWKDHVVGLRYACGCGDEGRSVRRPLCVPRTRRGRPAGRLDEPAVRTAAVTMGTDPRRPRRVVIVGGVAAGMSAATRLRRNDEQARILVLERGGYVSFANCGLPYHVGDVISERSDLILQTPESLAARFRLDVRVRHEVVGIDRMRRTVRVRDLRTGQMFTEPYDELVLATGASPVVPDIPGIERGHTLRSIEDLDRIVAALGTAAPAPGTPQPAAVPPRSAAVLGGGFIGLELAENLTRRGIDVTVVELADQVLTPLDAEMAGPVAEHLRRNGVDVRTGVGAVRIEPDTVELSDGSAVPAELLVVSVGVAPESGLARAAGLRLGARGGIAVDEQQRTSDPHVFAIGDVAEKVDAVVGGPTLVPLAHVANRHGRLVADVITGRPVSAMPAVGTAIVGVFGLTVATTGSSEKRLRTAGRDVRAIHSHPSSHAGYYPGAESMALKLVVDPRTDAILGAQGVGGEGVDKRIDVIATAMRGGLTASDLADLELAYAPQFGSAKDPVNMLGMIADNLAAGFTRTVQWHEVEAAVAGGATVLDIRTPAEVADGAIPGAVHVPLDELRDRLVGAESDPVVAGFLPSGPLVICCEAGVRGHVATRLLRQHGRDVANLDGGYRTWAAGSRWRSLQPVAPLAR